MRASTHASRDPIDVTAGIYLKNKSKFKPPNRPGDLYLNHMIYPNFKVKILTKKLKKSNRLGSSKSKDIGKNGI